MNVFCSILKCAKRKKMQLLSSPICTVTPTAEHIAKSLFSSAAWGSPFGADFLFVSAIRILKLNYVEENIAANLLTSVGAKNYFDSALHVEKSRPTRKYLSK